MQRGDPKRRYKSCSHFLQSMQSLAIHPTSYRFVHECLDSLFSFQPQHLTNIIQLTNYRLLNPYNYSYKFHVLY